MDINIIDLGMVSSLDFRSTKKFSIEGISFNRLKSTAEREPIINSVFRFAKCVKEDKSLILLAWRQFSILGF